ncbi:putative calcium-binding protein [Trypanosoma grayi]|uniref:putative calcium-binding protein n=1 Tax=Trypanosoma grayi TaxID=71804 RepID=UPI0004F4052E|nr:putative calcium-binding protein [Trypanosoma grayi]KEG11497.1 putative calcium-binding protein [Trypanosoma grayi]
MSVRMNTTLYSDANRLERGDFLLFHCVQLSQHERDVQRYFIGCYFPRWRGFYVEEVRELPGPLGYKVPRHFPAYPFDVYVKDDGEHFLTDDFQVGTVFTLGAPQNQRDDAAKRYKVVHCDDTRLRTRTGAALAAIGNDITTRLNHTHRVAGEAVELLCEIREAYVMHAGNGIPEIGIKAMGRHFRRVSADGKRWMSLENIEKFVRDSRAFTTTLSFNDTQQSSLRISHIAETIHAAFPQNEEGCIDYDFFMDYVRGPMSQRRKDAVWNIFRKLDFDGNGYLNILDIQARYNAQEHPVVMVERLFSADKLLKGFLTVWDENKQYGLIPYSEFVDYYNGVSAVIEEDDVFFDILKNQWKEMRDWVA